MCSRGDVHRIYGFSDLRTLTDTLGTGPLVEATAHALAVGGGVVYCVRCGSESTPGTFGAVTRTGTGTATLAITGSPLDAYELVVTITRAGASLATATAAFQLSLDGGDNYSPEIAVPTAGAYPLAETGLTLTFGEGTFVVGDTFRAASVAPGFNLTELTAALQALLADPRTWKFVHVVGQAATATGSAALASALDMQMTAAQNAYRFTYALLEAAAVPDAALLDAFRSVASVRVMACAGFTELTSVLSGRQLRRHAAWPIAARRARVPMHEDTGRVATGALPGVLRLYRDEQVTPGLDARFATLRTIIGKQGFFVTNGRVLAPSGSDFDLAQNREVMDVACAVARTGLLEYVNDSIRVNPANVKPPATPGGVDERDARAIESRVGGLLRATLLAPGSASAVTVAINRTDNLLSTRTLRAKVRVLPLGYAKFIEADLGFVNPALTVG